MKQNITSDVGFAISNGDTSLGLEIGSTRIKAVLVGPNYAPIASGSYDWENRLKDGYWTYPLSEVWEGIQHAYANLSLEVMQKYGIPLKKIGSIGFSSMMHGYLPFDKEGNLLVPFRTWRNTTTADAASKLTKLFGFNIPQRWSVAHLYQAVLNGETHVSHISFLTTLAGYVHWKLTGQKVLGVGDASGMFPIDSSRLDYNQEFIEKFDLLMRSHGYAFHIRDVLPQIFPAGTYSGSLTLEGAKLLDPSGTLQAGIPLCPPEGDACTGMVATNSIAVRTGNVSAGTSVFAMVVLEHPLSHVHPEIDLVTTPVGLPVAMVHCNTCTSDLDAWIHLFEELLQEIGATIPRSKLYDLFYQKALLADSDCGGLISFNYYSGEPVIGLENGCPLLVRRPDAKLNFSNFSRVQLYSSIATLKIGMDLLFQNEGVKLDAILGHGGLFKTPNVGQKLLAGALNVPVSVMETAGEGGPWGMALLAAYLKDKAPGQSLEEFLSERVFCNSTVKTQLPEPSNLDGFSRFIQNYKSCIKIEKAAVDVLFNEAHSC